MTGYGRCGKTRTQRRNIPARRITREVHSKNVIWLVGQAIRPEILGKVRKKLEMMERQETGKKRDDEDNPRRGKGRKIRSSRMDRRR